LDKLLFYEFALATDQDIFKNAALKLCFFRTTEPVRNILLLPIQNIQTGITIKVKYHLSLELDNCIMQIHVCGVWTACLNCHDAHGVVTHLTA
jgi:hypothetical protein